MPLLTSSLQHAALFTLVNGHFARMPGPMQAISHPRPGTVTLKSQKIRMAEEIAETRRLTHSSQTTAGEVLIYAARRQHGACHRVVMTCFCASPENPDNFADTHRTVAECPVTPDFASSPQEPKRNKHRPRSCHSRCRRLGRRRSS